MNLYAALEFSAVGEARSSTVTVVPEPTVLAMVSEPLCRSTSDFEIARPRPDPPLLLVNWFSTCSKGRPSFSMSLVGIPMPVSTIVRNWQNSLA